MSPRRPALLPMFLLAAAILLLAGCGGSGGGDGGGDEGYSGGSSKESSGSAEGGGSGETIELGVDGNKLEFDKTELEAAAGTVTLKLENTSSIPHNVAIETEDGESLDAGEIVGQGETSEASAELEAGTYQFVCDPHKSAGMKGTLVVS